MTSRTTTTSLPRAREITAFWSSCRTRISPGSNPSPAAGRTQTGPPGAGHFTKLIHNGIEFGMLQAIGESIDLLEHYDNVIDIPEVLRCWRHGSVIRSWLIDLMEEAYRSNGGTEKIPSYVDDTGEVNWLVDDALHMKVPCPSSLRP